MTKQPKAIIYARVSSDKQNEDSIERQVELCGQLAKREGLSVAAVYEDTFISGAVRKRPGFLQARDALLNDPDIGCLLLYKTSRLDRSGSELPALQRKLKQPALRTKYILTTDGFDSRNKSATILGGVHAAIDATYLENLADDTYTGLSHAFANGYSAGGRSYGYDSRPIDPQNPKTSRYKKVVNPKEAKIVLEIFEAFAYRDMSPREIAKDLNRRRIPSPGATWKRNGGKATDGKWRASAIYGDPTRGIGILSNPLYNGEYVWGRTKWWKDEDGVRRCEDLPETEWKRQPAEHLRIVPRKAWQDVQTKLKLIRKKSQKQRAAMRASGGRRNSYILSGILKCSRCGRSYTVCDSRRYKCSGSSDKLCDNDLAISRKKIEPAVLGAVQRELLSDDVLKLAQKEMRRLLDEEKQHRASASPKADVRRQLEECQRRIDRLSMAVDATDEGIEGLVTKLRAAMAERKELEAKLGTAPMALQQLPDDVFGGLRYYRDQVAAMADPSGVRSADVEKRAILERLLGEITVTPYPRKRELELEFGLGAEALASVLPAGRANAYIVVAGARFGRNLRKASSPVCLTLPKAA